MSKNSPHPVDLHVGSRILEPVVAAIGMGDFSLGRLIPLTRGHFAIVDSADYDDVSRLSWTASETRHKVYAMRLPLLPDGTYKREYLHRRITGANGPGVVSFRNGYSLDCRRDNLRQATQANIRQCCVSRHGRSRFKGVYWHGIAGRWCVSIQANSKKHYLGLYDNEVMAAQVYDDKAVELHGEFARLNFPRAAT